jgi:hypothetical protein
MTPRPPQVAAMIGALLRSTLPVAAIRSVHAAGGTGRSFFTSGCRRTHKLASFRYRRLISPQELP